MRERHVLIGELAKIRIDAGRDDGAALDRLFEPVFGDFQTVAERRVRERDRARARNRARHIADAVVNDALFDEDGVVVRRNVGRFAASALVDRDVDEDSGA